MHNFSPTMMHTFHFHQKPEREIKVTRSYTRRGKEHTDTFYIERTNIPTIFCVPDSILIKTKDDSPYGCSGTARPGVYICANVELQVGAASHIYNGVGYLEINNII